MYVHIPGKFQIKIYLGIPNTVWCDKFLYDTSVFKGKFVFKFIYNTN